jgi:hypothetical protein
MSKRRDHSLLHEIGEAFKRDVNNEYRGPERGFVEGLSLALAQAFLHGARPPQELRQAITNELGERAGTRTLPVRSRRVY